MNPADDVALSASLRAALRAAGLTTREQLERAVKSGVLMHAPGVGMVQFREAEAWLRKTATTTLETCPTCSGIGVVRRAKT